MPITKISLPRRVRQTLLAMLALLAALAFISWLAVPRLLHDQVETLGSDALGRRLTVDALHFNPLRLRLELEGVRIAGSGDKPALEVGRAGASLSLASLWHLSPVISSVRVEDLAARITRAQNGRFDFQDIIDHIQAASAGKPASPEPARFSVNNIQLARARVEFDDRQTASSHLLEIDDLGIPFVSNLPARVELFVEPHLKAHFDGAPLALTGAIKPFASQRQATMDLVLDALDLVPLLAYAPPGSVPVNLTRGKLDARLHLRWSEAEEKKPQIFELSGRVALQGVKIADKKGAPLAGWESLRVDLAQLMPLTQPLELNLARVELDAPEVWLARDARGELVLPRMPATAPAKGAAPAAASPAPWVKLRSAAVRNGVLHWQDASVRGGFRDTLRLEQATLTALDTRAKAPARAELSLTAESGAHLKAKAAIGLVSAQHEAEFELDSLALAHLQPYLEPVLGALRLEGTASAGAKLAIALDGKTPRIQLSAGHVGLKDFRAAGADATHGPLVAIPQLALDGVAVDTATHKATLQSLRADKAQVRVARVKGGAIDLLALLPAEKPAPAAASAPHAAAAPAWALGVGKLALDGARVSFTDASGAKPVALELSDFALKLADWQSASKASAHFELGGKVNGKGSLRLDGEFAGGPGGAPLAGSARIELARVDCLLAQPYLDQHFKVLLTQGSVSARGQLRFDTAGASPEIAYTGDLSLDGFNALDRINDTDFIRWTRISAQGLAVQTRPLALKVQTVRLDDFYTRLILDAQGRLNLRELTAEDRATLDKAEAKAVPEAVKQSESMPRIDVGNVVITRGQVDYSDRFVKPGYEAHLVGLGGQLRGLSTDAAKVAQLELGARLDGSAPVAIKGELNPFRKDRYLDLKVNVTDVDLTSVSSYAAKYVGYGINEGRLSMEANYRVRDRALTADNRIVLDRLGFGDRVDSPQATSLPVLFAVALLKDRHGVIDLNLPVQGSLDDPEFSIGRIVVKVLMNTIEKAVTAPFSLLGSVFGGGAEMSELAFPSGQATVPEAGLVQLRKLAQALSDRPALRLEVAGRVDAASDAQGLREASLERRLRTLKAEAMVKAGQSVSDTAKLVLSPAERGDYLWRLYRDAEIADRPRNAVGMLRHLPDGELEKALLGAVQIGAGELDGLANQRAQRTRQWLVEEGKIPAERVFLRSNAASGTGPGVSFSLR